jgi:acyl-CoA thioesterase
VPAKNKKRAPGLDLQNAFLEHVSAQLRAIECCEKAVALRAVGKHQAASRAERAAKRQLRMMLSIESALPPRPQGGRRVEL